MQRVSESVGKWRVQYKRRSIDFLSKRRRSLEQDREFFRYMLDSRTDASKDFRKVYYGLLSEASDEISVIDSIIEDMSA